MKSKAKGKKNKKRKWVSALAWFILIGGLGVILYPHFSDWYYRMDQNNQVTEFKAAKQEISAEEINERIRLAEAYNRSLQNVVDKDPYGEDNLAEGIAHYAKMLELHEKIGVIEVPTADINLPVYAGTSEDVLQKAAGHLEGTSLPIGGNSTHTVITGHSGLPQVRLFTDLHKVKRGDKFYFHNIKEVLAYQVDEIKVINPSDFSKLLIVPGHDYMTLLTCTPVGINTHRLIVRGHRVPYVQAVEEQNIEMNRTNFRYQRYFYISIAVIILLLLLIIRIKRRQKKQRLAASSENFAMEKERKKWRKEADEDDGDWPFIGDLNLNSDFYSDEEGASDDEN